MFKMISDMKLDLVFVLKASVFFLYIEWHFSSCNAAPCYDFFTKEARPCFPQPVNAARGRNVTASNTCGMPRASYCEISPEKKCFICDSNSSLSMHPAEYMVDEESPFASEPTWWQSDTWWDAIQKGISNIGEPLHVNITLKLGKSYHISGKIRVTFYSERPQAMIIERSRDGGETWQVYQYFAEDCEATYGMTASEAPSTDDPLEVICSEEYSRQFPEKNGVVEFQAYTRYLPENYMDPNIQSYMLATHVRVRLEYPGTDGLELINSEVTLNRYYYAISDTRIDGRCNCHGHAEYCDGVGMNQYCFCEHNTMGRDCEYCRPLYNKQPWKAANTTHANECQKCDCNDHASSCSYDVTVGTGICHDCNHNTSGIHCHECADGFYKDIEKSLNDSDVCLPCDCFSVGITDAGYCNQDISSDSLGQCNCKDNVFGRQCDECVPGYWGFRLPPGGHCQACSCNLLGTMNNSQTCDQQTGSCFCKPNIEGEKCNECKNGYYHFPTEQQSDCLECPCDVGGAYEICEKQTGQCNCRPNIEGEYCKVPKSGFYVPLFDYLVFEAEFQDGNDDIQYGMAPRYEHYTGQGFALLLSDSNVHFLNIKVKITWRYHIVIRNSYNPQHSNTVFTLAVESEGITQTISHSQLQVDARSITTKEAFTLTANEVYNVTINFTSASSSIGQGLLVDSLVFKPEVADTRISEQIDVAEILLRCFVNATYLSSTSETDLSCSDVVFSFSAEMYDGAMACDCDSEGSRESSSCSPLGGQCDCYTGVSGRRCSYCLPEYHGFGDGDCKVCECNSAGSENKVCDLTSGLCECKLHAEGEKCDMCKVGTFNLDVENEQGCQSCFGYGHGTKCTSAQGYVAANITTDFSGSTLGGWLPDSAGGVATSGINGLLIRGNLTLSAPSKYLGLQLNSYKQTFSAKISTSANLTADEISLALTGRNYDIQLRPEIARVSDSHYEIVFTLDENHLVGDGIDMTAFQFQSLLSNITSLGLKVQSELVVREVVLETAVYDPANVLGNQISFVENMTCFENYTGLSCEECASGFTRENADSGPFSMCVTCSCNGRSSQCDPESGVCIGCDIGSTGDYCENCEFNVIGPYCNVCADGFYGLTQDHKNCKPCDCHLPGTLYGNTSSCNLTTGQCKCNQTLHTGGKRCNVCQENAWNRTESSLNCEECPPCFGMIKLEVDKFRLQIFTLTTLFHSLLDMNILSQSFSFTERLKTIQDRVEEIVLRSETLTAEEDSAKLQLERGFDVLEVFDNRRLEEETEVNKTLNATNRILQKHRETVEIMQEIHSLITNAYDSLNNTLGDLLNEIQTSLTLLEDWVTELNEVNAQSIDKVKEIGDINKTIHDHLETTISLISKAEEDARAARDLFESLVSIIPTLRANMSAAKEMGKDAYDTARQRYNNASIVFNATSHLEIHNGTSSIAEEAFWLKELAQDVRKNATDVIEAVQKSSEECSKTVNQINVALRQISALQEQARTYEQQARERNLESKKYHAEAVTATHEAQEIEEHARNILDTVQNYGDVVEQAKLETQKSIQGASELTTFHQSSIEYAANITQLLQSSYNSSDSLVALAENVKNHAMEETEAISKTFALSQKLRNDTADEKAATVVRNHNIILDHIENQVNPIHEKCTSIQRDMHSTIANTTATQEAATQLLVKVKRVSNELGTLSTNHDALPTLNTRPLAAMVSDITRIRNSFQALKLSNSIQNLRQGKEEQQRWLDDHKPRMLKLRHQVAAMRGLIQSLKDIIPCE